MKVIRLIALTLMLTGVWFMPERPVSACAIPGANCPPPPEQRPDGCACCSDNHCESGKCDLETEECVPKEPLLD